MKPMWVNVVGAQNVNKIEQNQTFSRRVNVPRFQLRTFAL